MEGTLQEDGDYYVIDRDPRNPSSLLRVRKADVTNTEKSKTVHSAGGDRQLHHISIKRGVPVQHVSVTKSDQLLRPQGARLLNETVSVNFVNKTGFTETFTIIDKGNGQQLFYGQLDDGDPTGFLSVSTSGIYGQVSYQYQGQLTKPPTDSALLSALQ